MNRPTPAAPDDDDLTPLKAAAEGLPYPSETDAPFTPFQWPAASGASGRDAVAARVKSSPIEEVTLDEFFAELEVSDDGDRYAKLRGTLTSLLAGVTVVRAGRRKVDVFLIGRSRSGAWAGLRTVSVET